MAGFRERVGVFGRGVVKGGAPMAVDESTALRVRAGDFWTPGVFGRVFLTVISALSALSDCLLGPLGAWSGTEGFVCFGLRTVVFVVLGDFILLTGSFAPSGVYDTLGDVCAWATFYTFTRFAT